MQIEEEIFVYVSFPINFEYYFVIAAAAMDMSNGNVFVIAPLWTTKRKEYNINMKGSNLKWHSSDFIKKVFNLTTRINFLKINMNFASLANIISKNTKYYYPNNGQCRHSSSRMSMDTQLLSHSISRVV